MKRNDDKAGAAETSVVSADAALNANPEDVILQVYQVGDTEKVKPPKIRWLDSNYQSLIALIELLYRAGYIEKSDFRNAAALMHHHFINKDKNEISNVGARNVRSSVYYKNNRIDLMNEIIEKFNDVMFDLEGRAPTVTQP